MMFAGWVHTVQWREPWWLLLALQPLILYILNHMRGRHRTAAYVEPALAPWVRRGTDTPLWRRFLSRATALALAWVLFAGAMAGPRIPVAVPGSAVKAGVNIMAVIDLSRSMTAADVNPTRFERAREKLYTFLDRLGVNRLGIVVFAGRAHLMAPPTGDRAVLRNYLQALSPGLLPTEGSNLSAGIALARRELRRDGGPGAILVLADGDGMDAKAVISTAGSVPVYLLGMGTVEGDAIPLPGGGWLRIDGHAVITRLNETGLRRVARATGGRYITVRGDDSDIASLYSDINTRLQRPSRGRTPGHIVWHELYPWLLLPAILLLFLAAFSLRRRLPGALVCALLATAFASPPPARAESQANLARRAYAAYLHKDYARAIRLYEGVAGYGGDMGIGVCAYRQGAYTRAVRRFTRAVLAAPDNRTRATALFNLGNSYFQLAKYGTAAGVFADARRYRPDYPHARANQAFALALQREVDARLGQPPPGTLGGSGPQPSRAPGSGTDLGNTMVVLGESKTRGREVLPQLPPLSQQNLTELIARGVRRATSAGGYVQSHEDQSPAGENQPLSAARARLEELQDRESRLWKRLFQIEEGFPGPVDKPEPIPGVKPW